MDDEIKKYKSATYFKNSVDISLNSKDAEQKIEALASDKRIYHGF